MKNYNLLSVSKGKGITTVTFSIPYTAHKKEPDFKEHTIYRAIVDSMGKWRIETLVHNPEVGPIWYYEAFIPAEGEMYDWVICQIK